MEKEIVIEINIFLFKDGTFKVERRKADDVSPELAPILTAGLVQMASTTLSGSDPIKEHDDTRPTA